MRIFLVDDEKEIADLIELYLKNDGFDVIKCSDGKTALEKINIEKAKMLLDSGLAKGGMIPKIRNIINLIENGVKEVAILNGRVRYNIISEFIGAKTVGTVVTRD